MTLHPAARALASLRSERLVCRIWLRADSRPPATGSLCVEPPPAAHSRHG